MCGRGWEGPLPAAAFPREAGCYGNMSLLSSFQKVVQRSVGEAAICSITAPLGRMTVRGAQQGQCASGAAGGGGGLRKDIYFLVQEHQQ